jgi:acyl CoA:acetate/3-ketoacid CoA transferase beta subunit
MGMLNQGLFEFDPYTQDYDFLNDRKTAQANSEDYNAWINQWVLSCQTHQEYLNKLGYERLASLKGKADKDAWKYHLETVKPEISTEKGFNETEMMTVAASRLIKDRVVAKGYKVVQVGIGIAALAGCLAYYQLQQEKLHVDLIWGSGQFGYTPQPGEPFLTSHTNMQNCTMFTDITEMYGIIIGGEYNKCLSIIGAAQIDKHGAVNSTKLDDDSFLVGSGGAADATNAQEIMVVTKQSKSRFLEKVSYVSSIGTKTKKMVTNLGVFEKTDDNAFILTRYHPNSAFTTPEEHIRAAKEKCGWDLKIAPDIKATEPPTEAELLTLRLLDPKRYFLK